MESKSITIDKKQRKGFLKSIYKYASATKISHHTPEFVKYPTTKEANYSDYPVIKREIGEELVADSGGRSGKMANGVKGQQVMVASPRAIMHSSKMVVAEVARKSVSHLETNLTSVAAFLQVKVLVTDMPGFMQVHAFKCARRTYDSLEKFSARHMAYNIKKEFDKTYGPAWHCIVGSSFGSFVTHSTGCFLYFSMEKLYILVFRTKVQKSSD